MASRIVYYLPLIFQSNSNILKCYNSSAVNDILIVVWLEANSSQNFMQDPTKLSSTQDRHDILENESSNVMVAPPW
jgi:hypothetical protein